MKATVLIAGFEHAEARDAAAELLAAGACVLLSADTATSLRHLDGGLVDAVVVSTRHGASGNELKTRAGRLGLAILVMDPPLHSSELPALVQAALRR